MWMFACPSAQCPGNGPVLPILQVYRVKRTPSDTCTEASQAALLHRESHVIIAGWLHDFEFQSIEARLATIAVHLELARAKTPPYTGYGSWDDSMGSVTHLIPKLPKKDQGMFCWVGCVMCR